MNLSKRSNRLAAGISLICFLTSQALLSTPAIAQEPTALTSPMTMLTKTLEAAEAAPPDIKLPAPENFFYPSPLSVPETTPMPPSSLCTVCDNTVATLHNEFKRTTTTDTKYLLIFAHSSDSSNISIIHVFNLKTGALEATGAYDASADLKFDQGTAFDFTPSSAQLKAYVKNTWQTLDNFKEPVLGYASTNTTWTLTQAGYKDILTVITNNGPFSYTNTYTYAKDSVDDVTITNIRHSTQDASGQNLIAVHLKSGNLNNVEGANVDIIYNQSEGGLHLYLQGTAALNFAGYQDGSNGLMQVEVSQSPTVSDTVVFDVFHNPQTNLNSLRLITRYSTAAYKEAPIKLVDEERRILTNDQRYLMVISSNGGAGIAQIFDRITGELEGTVNLYSNPYVSSTRNFQYDANKKELTESVYNFGTKQWETHLDEVPATTNPMAPNPNVKITKSTSGTNDIVTWKNTANNQSYTYTYAKGSVIKVLLGDSFLAVQLNDGTIDLIVNSFASSTPGTHIALKSSEISGMSSYPSSLRKIDISTGTQTIESVIFDTRGSIITRYAGLKCSAPSAPPHGENKRRITTDGRFELLFFPGHGAGNYISFTVEIYNRTSGKLEGTGLYSWDIRNGGPQPQYQDGTRFYYDYLNMQLQAKVNNAWIKLEDVEKAEPDQVPNPALTLQISHLNSMDQVILRNPSNGASQTFSYPLNSVDDVKVGKYFLTVHLKDNTLDAIATTIGYAQPPSSVHVALQGQTPINLATLPANGLLQLEIPKTDTLSDIVVFTSSGQVLTRYTALRSLPQPPHLQNEIGRYLTADDKFLVVMTTVNGARQVQVFDRITGEFKGTGKGFQAFKFKYDPVKEQIYEFDVIENKWLVISIQGWSFENPNIPWDYMIIYTDVKTQGNQDVVTVTLAHDSPEQVYTYYYPKGTVAQVFGGLNFGIAVRLKNGDVDAILNDFQSANPGVHVLVKGQVTTSIMRLSSYGSGFSQIEISSADGSTSQNIVFDNRGVILTRYNQLAPSDGEFKRAVTQDGKYLLTFKESAGFGTVLLRTVNIYNRVTKELVATANYFVDFITGAGIHYHEGTKFDFNSDDLQLKALIDDQWVTLDRILKPEIDPLPNPDVTMTLFQENKQDVLQFFNRRTGQNTYFTYPLNSVDDVKMGKSFAAVHLKDNTIDLINGYYDALYPSYIYHLHLQGEIPINLATLPILSEFFGNNNAGMQIEIPKTPTTSEIIVFNNFGRILTRYSVARNVTPPPILYGEEPRVGRLLTLDDKYLIVVTGRSSIVNIFERATGRFLGTATVPSDLKYKYKYNPVSNKLSVFVADTGWITVNVVLNPKSVVPNPLVTTHLVNDTKQGKDILNIVNSSGSAAYSFSYDLNSVAEVKIGDTFVAVRLKSGKIDLIFSDFLRNPVYFPANHVYLDGASALIDFFLLANGWQQIIIKNSSGATEVIVLDNSGKVITRYIKK